MVALSRIVFALACGTALDALATVPASTQEPSMYVAVLDLDSGSPLGGVDVRILGSEGTELRRAITDAQGLFSIDAWHPDALVMVQKRGYVQAEPHERLHGRPASRVSTLPRRAGRLQVGMRRTASIAGVVATTDGRPLEVPLHVTLETVSAAGEAQTTRTTPDGRYEFRDVPPGDYALFATSREKHPPPLMADRYRRTYYFDGRSVRDAVVVSVEPGQSLQGVDWLIATNQLYSLAVRLSQRVIADVRVLSFPPGLLRTGRTDNAGTLVLDQLPEGAYVVTATTVEQPVQAAARTVHVGFDASETQLDLDRPAAVKGLVVVSEPGDVAYSALSVSLPLTDGTSTDPLSSADTQVSENGRFQMENLVGPRKVVVAGLPAHCSVSEVVLDGRPHDEPFVEFPAGETSELEVRVRCD